MKIGIVGTGRMGTAIAQRLMSLGHEVAVWNRTTAKTRELAAQGARVAPTPMQLAREADCVLSILTDAAAIDASYRGAQGLLAADLSGKLVIEMSTVRPETERALAAEVRARGGALLDCPVGGTVGPAREGKLFGFVGGEAADVERARPLLEQLCRRIEHVGAVSAGASMKLAINLPLLVFWQSFGEALSLCKPLGIDPQRLMNIFADTSGGPNVLKARGAALAAALSGGDAGAVGFNVDSIRKDLRTMLEEARALGTELPVAARALESFDQAAAEGLGASDGVMLPVRWVRRSASTRSGKAG